MHTVEMPTLRPRDQVPSIPHDVSAAKHDHPSIVEEDRFAGQVDKCFPETTSAPVKGQRVRTPNVNKETPKTPWMSYLRDHPPDQPVFPLPSSTP
nr:unnamed protein product [Spirometra erinaceieuropaei]